MLATKFGTMMMTVIGGQALHDEAQPVEGREDLDVEGGGEQVAIGVHLGQDVQGVVLHVGEVGPEPLRDRALAAKHLGQHVARRREEARDPQQLLAEPEEVGRRFPRRP